ncbi:polycystic kidney disease 2-like 2 protein [Scaptodrosophila lebanonensis]|uniref:Polycystic kidney disease 2-like 2 protein n=1 Tax=Drosophila lebanonensis TaxID=7225 RepID=A0A6J2U0F0_DROLE|nr:polycystic kidney disease 2-like 2 protein [Scaptodrosophila lebanonensis]
MPIYKMDRLRKTYEDPPRPTRPPPKPKIKKKRKKNEKLKRRILRKLIRILVGVTRKSVFFINTKSERIRYATIIETRAALREFAAYLIFLVLATIVTQTYVHQSMYYSNDTSNQLLSLRKKLIKPSVFFEYNRINSINAFWIFMMTTFFEIFEHNDFNPNDRANIYNFTNETTTFSNIYGDVFNRTLLHGNILLGAPRLRQIRVARGLCVPNVALGKYLPDCFAPYSWFNEDRSDYRGIPFTSLTTAWTTPIWDEIDIYLGAGYVFDFTYDQDENRRLAMMLNKTNWLDAGSRLILLEYTLFHVNSRLFQSVKFLLECPPTGGILPQTRFRNLRYDCFFTDPSWKVFTAVIFYYILVGLRTKSEIIILRDVGFKTYRKNLVNAMDGSVCILSYVMVVYHVLHLFYMKKLTNAVKSTDEFITIDWGVFWNIQYANIAATVVFLAWMRLLHFIAFNRTMVIFVNVLKACANDLFGYFLMITAVLLAYAQYGMLLFGAKHRYFRNYVAAFMNMIRWILCDFDYRRLDNANSVIAPIYCVSYILSVYVILLHVFLAIINATYDMVKRDLKTKPQKLGAVFKIWMWNIFDFFYLICKRKKRPPNPSRTFTNEDPYETDQRIDPREAARAAIARKIAERNEPGLPMHIYVPARISRADLQLDLFFELLGHLTHRFNKMEERLTENIEELKIQRKERVDSLGRIPR